ncbi:divalent-cation tolerance protein CutA [Methanococcoides methylutens]|uniref:Periplasmic divalent cation tolerance protein CutA n=1 Tax=Methanococcoides methylutens MM1 TaxID=1434104 RepID=A0A0E3SRX7_METMT|nr:divalent-cation tolerance protein CutA [Methanococcoides methylutens]AKB85806.1 Periplasmic divalent cation tolerance protein CutA [Methanococcoides methylutens MM1]
MYHIMVYITAGSMDEARTIGRELVSGRFAACANIHPMSSIYWWNDELVEDDEVVLIVKTTGDKFEELKEKVSSLHSYDLPCIISWKITGEKNYLQWISDETGKL